MPSSVEISLISNIPALFFLFNDLKFRTIPVPININSSLSVLIKIEPVAAPFGDVAVHVVQPPGVRLKTADVRVLLHPVAAAGHDARTVSGDPVQPRIAAGRDEVDPGRDGIGRSRAAGVLPLRLGRQIPRRNARPGPETADEAVFVHAGPGRPFRARAPAADLGPGHALGGPFRARKPPAAGTGDVVPLRLRHLENADVERLADLHVPEGPLGARATELGVAAPHADRTRIDPAQHGEPRLVVVVPPPGRRLVEKTDRVDRVVPGPVRKVEHEVARRIAGGGRDGQRGGGRRENGSELHVGDSMWAGRIRYHVRRPGASEIEIARLARGRRIVV